jgi:hypothetical protein
MFGNEFLYWDFYIGIYYMGQSICALAGPIIGDFSSRIFLDLLFVVGDWRRRQYCQSITFEKTP